MFSECCLYLTGRERVCIEIPVAFLLILFSPMLSTAADYNIITTNLAPWSMDENTGIFQDIVIEIEKRLGTNNIPRELPLNRALKYYALADENYIIFPLARTDSFEKDYTWIIDVMPFEIVFATVGGNPVDLETARGLKNILAYQDLPAYNFLVEKGFKNINIYPFGKSSPLTMLSNGRADAWCIERTFARFFAKGTPYDGKLVFGPPIFKTQLYIAGSKNIASEIVSDYRKVFEEIRTEGIEDKIMIKYLSK